MKLENNTHSNPTHTHSSNLSLCRVLYLLLFACERPLPQVTRHRPRPGFGPAIRVRASVSMWSPAPGFGPAIGLAIGLWLKLGLGLELGQAMNGVIGTCFRAPTCTWSYSGRHSCGPNRGSHAAAVVHWLGTNPDPERTPTPNHNAEPNPNPNPNP